MTKILRDPLLSAAYTVVKTCRNLFALAAALILFSVPFAVIFRDTILGIVHTHFSIASSHYPVSSVVGLLLFVCAVLTLWWLFFRTLSDIVETVVQGDPFISLNTSRLQRMAGLLLVIQLAYIPTAALGLVVETAFKGPTSEVDVFWDFTGLLMVVTLFVLARIFRHGTNLRNDLEGTV